VKEEKKITKMLKKEKNKKIVNDEIYEQFWITNVYIF